MQSAPRRLPVLPVTVFLVFLLVVCLIAGALVGEPLPATEVAKAVLHPALPFVPPADEITTGIVQELRLPRLLMAALVGAMLAVAGASLQSILGNPLADPYIIGVSSGAAVGAGLALLLGVAALWGGLAQSGMAFIAALLALALVFALSRVGGRLQTGAFLLAGVVAGSLLWSLTTLLLSLAGQEQRSLLLFLMGRFTEATWSGVLLLAPVTVLGIAYCTVSARSLDAFAFGEEVARSVGVEVERFKGIILTLSALLTAAAVSTSGIIGFVGLVVPHLGRALVGPPHRGLIPVVALLGAILTLLADLLARTIRPGEELPVGIVTALLGAPFFLTLLRRLAGER
ncbi:MAG: iron ABC transporter permease [Armatimonadaceae bacterium]